MGIGNHSLPSNLLDGCNGILYCTGKWASDVTGGFYWIGIAIALISIAFMITARYGTPRAFGFSGFVSIIVGIWLAIIGYLTWWIASLFILIGVGGFAAMIMNER